MTETSAVFSSVQTLLDETRQALKRGQPAEGARLALQVIASEPDHAEAHYLAGAAYLETLQWSLALKHSNRAVALDAKNAEYATLFGRALASAQMYGEALQVANIAYGLPSTNPQTMNFLGTVYMQCHAHERANLLFRRAVASAPDNALYRFNQAVTDTFTADFASAEAQFDACIRLEPKSWSAYGLRSLLKRQTAAENHVDALHALLAANTDDVDAQIHLHGALGKEYEDLGDYTSAFEHMSSGKASARKRVAYRPEQDSAMVDAMVSAFPDAISTDTGYGSDEPIFVVGMPRSGTTLVERILSSHPQVYSAGELMNFGVQLARLAPPGVPARLEPSLIAHSHQFDWRYLGLRYVDSTRPQTAVKPHFIDKLPHNFLYLGHIAKALPKARIVCLRRHPLDACLSNFREMFKETSSFHGYSFDLLDIGHFYIQFDRMMAHWQKVMPGRVLQVSYENLIAEQESTTRQLLAHCGLPWNEACLRFEQNSSAVATASTVQVRQPIHRNAAGRWKNYQPWLGPLVQLLNEAGIATDA
jgi:tetratricopeptide (TPR) repeat protein